MINKIVGDIFGKDKQEILEGTSQTLKNKLSEIKDNLNKASMLHYGIEKYISYGNSHIIELKNGWVVEMSKNSGRVLHIYEDKGGK